MAAEAAIARRAVMEEEVIAPHVVMAEGAALRAVMVVEAVRAAMVEGALAAALTPAEVEVEATRAVEEAVTQVAVEEARTVEGAAIRIANLSF